jgi:hypothetical protein
LKWDNLAFIAEISPNNENQNLKLKHFWRLSIVTIEEKNWLNCIIEDCHFEQLHHKNEKKKKKQLEMG